MHVLVEYDIGVDESFIVLFITVLVTSNKYKYLNMNISKHILMIFACI